MIFKNNYVVPNFNYRMLFCMTISTASYVSMIEFMEKNNDDENDIIMQLTSFTVVLV
jgi:hypothetical protein